MKRELEASINTQLANLTLSKSFHLDSKPISRGAVARLMGVEHLLVQLGISVFNNLIHLLPISSGTEAWGTHPRENTFGTAACAHRK